MSSGASALSAAPSSAVRFEGEALRCGVRGLAGGAGTASRRASSADSAHQSSSKDSSRPMKSTHGKSGRPAPSITDRKLA